MVYNPNQYYYPNSLYISMPGTLYFNDFVNSGWDYKSMIIFIIMKWIINTIEEIFILISFVFLLLFYLSLFSFVYLFYFIIFIYTIITLKWKYKLIYIIIVWFSFKNMYYII